MLMTEGLAIKFTIFTVMPLKEEQQIPKFLLFCVPFQEGEIIIFKVPSRVGGPPPPPPQRMADDRCIYLEV